MTLGDIEIRLSNYDLATPHYESALSSMNYTREVAVTYYAVAEKVFDLYMENGQFEKALKQAEGLKLHLEICCEADFNHGVQTFIMGYLKTLRKMSQCNVLLGSYTEAVSILHNIQKFLDIYYSKFDHSWLKFYDREIKEDLNFIQHMLSQSKSFKAEKSEIFPFHCNVYGDSNYATCNLGLAEENMKAGRYHSSFLVYETVYDYFIKRYGTHFENFFVAESLHGMGVTSLRLEGAP